MVLKNKVRPAPSKTTFSVTKEILYLDVGIGRSTSKKRKESTSRPTVLGILGSITDLNPKTIGKIEEKLKLGFISEKEENGNVCMTNSPEVRDEYKDSFNAKDLLYYMYAVVHSPRYHEKFEDLSKIDVIEVPHPNDKNRFWKLSSLGARLLQLHLLGSSSVEKYSDATVETMNRIAEIEIRENQ